MNSEQLLAHYGQISEAPDAIAKLRRFVLDLAVRGKLVEQDGERGHAESLEGPFALPSDWCWRRIGDELDLLNGMAFKPTDWVPSGLPIVRIQNLNNPLAPFNFCDPAKARDRSLIDNGAFLISWSGTPGTSFGAFIWQRGAAVLNQHIFRCDFKTKNFDQAFLRLAINGRLDEMIAKAHGGVGLQHITKGKLEAMLIALPPLAEQHRIVAKVDELMALCDQLEAARAEREAARDRFALSTLARLNTPDPETFPNDARFALVHLGPLTKRMDQIKQLRKTILNLAVRGKLVDQDANDEPASALLKEIAAEKARLVHAGEVRKPKAVPDLVEYPYTLPNSWSWSQIAEVGIINPRVDADENTVASFVPMPLISADYGVQNGHEPRPWGQIKKGYTHFAEGDVGLAKITPCFENGKSTVFQNLTGGIGSGTTELHVVRPLFIDPSYILIFWKCSFFIESGIPRMTGTAGQKRVPTDYFANGPFPLPPLAEQHRIVAKVDELMALCDQLEASLTEGEQTRSKLLEAVLHEALEPA